MLHSWNADLIRSSENTIIPKAIASNHTAGEFKWRSYEPIKENAVALVRKRTTPTERPPLVGQVSANFRG
jgi:hypothetical protein